ncbi:putative mediator of RNA polymerase II transcription subunit 26 [Lingula anatina]|uniref:Mediator of RNA polymerase II transcription subunit 26 n=1 Tax=Lingula anatina TaxID=7574 RepID=A0A1S3JFC1_LINAN|nr:putative mediator of RNA polymerase II transcription subunit 26 [Lingula anatina]|eukprot:XP_013409038.1 putative mediator of RNA polymerase II transcription subunit 26 [Lingula anatina]
MKETKTVTPLEDTQDDIQGSMSAGKSCLEDDECQFSSDQDPDVTNSQQQSAASCNLTPGQKLVQYFTSQTTNMNSSQYANIGSSGSNITRQDSSGHNSGSSGTNIGSMLTDEQHQQQQHHGSYATQNQSNLQQQSQPSQPLYGETANSSFSPQETITQHHDHFDSSKLDGLSEHLEESAFADHFSVVVGSSEHVDQAIFVQTGASKAQQHCGGTEQQQNQQSSTYQQSQQSSFNVSTQQVQFQQQENFQTPQEQQQHQSLQYQQFLGHFQQPQAANKQQDSFQRENSTPLIQQHDSAMNSHFHQQQGTFQRQNSSFVQQAQPSSPAVSEANPLSQQSMPVLQHGMMDQSALQHQRLQQGQPQQQSLNQQPMQHGQSQQQLLQQQLQHNQQAQLQQTGMIPQSLIHQIPLDNQSQQQQKPVMHQQQLQVNMAPQEPANLQIAALQQQISALQQQIQQNPVQQNIQAQLDQMRQQIQALQNPIQRHIQGQPGVIPQQVQVTPSPIQHQQQMQIQQQGALSQHMQSQMTDPQSPMTHQIQSQTTPLQQRADPQSPVTHQIQSQTTPLQHQVQTQPSPVPQHVQSPMSVKTQDPQSPLQIQMQAQQSPMSQHTSVPSSPIQNPVQMQNPSIHQIQTQQNSVGQQSPVPMQPSINSPIQQQIHAQPSPMSQQVQSPPNLMSQQMQSPLPQSPRQQQKMPVETSFAQPQIQGCTTSVSLPIQSQPNQLQHPGPIQQSPLLQSHESPSPMQRIQNQQNPTQHFPSDQQLPQSQIFGQPSNSNLQQELKPKQSILQAYLEQQQVKDEKLLPQLQQQSSIQQELPQTGIQQQLQQEQSLLQQLQQQQQKPQAAAPQGLDMNQFPAGQSSLPQQQQLSQLQPPHQNLLQQQQQQEQPMQVGTEDQNQNFLVASSVVPSSFQIQQTPPLVVHNSFASLPMVAQPQHTQSSLSNTLPAQTGAAMSVTSTQQHTTLLQGHQEVEQSWASQQQDISLPLANQQNNNVFDSVMASQILQQQQLQKQTSHGHEEDDGHGFVTLATKELVQLLAETSTHSQQHFQFDQQQHVSSLAQMISQPLSTATVGVMSQRGAAATGVAFLQQVLRDNTDLPAGKSESGSHMNTFNVNSVVTGTSSLAASVGSTYSSQASVSQTSNAVFCCQQSAVVQGNRSVEAVSILQGHCVDSLPTFSVAANNVFETSAPASTPVETSTYLTSGVALEARTITTVAAITPDTTAVTPVMASSAPKELLKFLITETHPISSTVESFSKPQTELARHLDDEMFLSPTHSDSDQEPDSTDVSTPIASMSEDTQMALVQRSNDLVLDDETIFSTLDEGEYFGGMFDNNYNKPRKVAKAHRHDTPSSRPSDCTTQKAPGQEKGFDVNGASVIFSKFGKDVPGVFTFTGNSTSTSAVLKTRPSTKPVVISKGLKREASGSCLGKSRGWKEPSLVQAFVSKVGEYELKVVTQPEKQHRARYMTEGSRGAIKDESQQGNPVVQLLGYHQPCTLQIFIGTDTGKVRPHGFYQVCKVSGKSSTPCRERDIDGTTVIEIDMNPESDMTVK